MGHCVGGYCADVFAGDTKIYSLRDPKGRSHVTVEVGQRAKRVFNRKPTSDEITTDILQIKGKQNRAPNSEYLPYVQDFVRSGKWGEVQDLQNTGLIRGDAVTGHHIPGDNIAYVNTPDMQSIS